MDDDKSKTTSAAAQEPSDENASAEESLAGAGGKLLRQGATGSLDRLYRDWFLDYASYVILDRAIPALDDGLKPVQRRLLHALSELDDGRFNKAANIIGQTMRYHPHGDMAISDALVKLGQKSLLIDTQGNWGNIATGDRAAAARYIEARLSPFGKEVLFQEEITVWQSSYDGRNKEPLALPVKFPLLLALGTEGIAVGLSTKILPHNFCELLNESIAVLKGQKPHVVPDFPTGGIADFSAYRDGKRGGRVKVRAVIEVVDAKTLCIRELPFGTTTTSLIESILASNDKGQIKIKKVEDNTAKDVEIMIHLSAGASPEKVVQALYVFTDCEISIAPNCCVIHDGKPQFCGASDLLIAAVDNTKKFLQQELEIAKEKLLAKIHFAILEQIFIQEKIYRKIEGCESWEEVLDKIAKSLKPFSKKFIRPLSLENIEKLTEIKIKRISKFDCDHADQALQQMHENLAGVQTNLDNLNRYAIQYFQGLLKRYGKGKERLTKIESFNKVEASAVVASDQKLYVNRKEGFAGTGLKKDEFVSDCSQLDEIIAFCKDGTFQVSKVSDKIFVGKNIIWVGIFKRNDERQIYNVIYQEGATTGSTFIKRFQVLSATRDKPYSLFKKGTVKGSVIYFSANPNGEAEKIRIFFKPQAAVKKKEHVFDFASVAIKKRTEAALKLTKHPVAKISLEEKGSSTLAAQRIWFDRTLGRLNREGQGLYLGSFASSEKLVALYQSGTYEILTADISQQFSEDLLEIQKWENNTLITVIYLDGGRGDVYVKRIAIQDDQIGCKDYIARTPGSRVLFATFKAQSVVKAEFDRTLNKKAPASQIIRLEEFMDIKSIKALGSKLTDLPVKEIKPVH